MNAKQIILSNFPLSEYWDENSFIAQLHEKGIWQNEAYLNLENSVYAFFESRKLTDLSWELFRIFSILMNLLIAHFDPDDYFEISNLSQEQVSLVKERVQLVFEGFFQGEMPNQRDF